MSHRSVTAILFGSAAIVATQNAHASDALTLKAELNRLKERLRVLEAAESRRASWIVVPAKAVEVGARPKSWKIPGTNTSLQIGGFVKLDFIYDVNGPGGDQLAAAGVPIDGTPEGNQQGHFRLHARESRFVVRSWTPTAWGELATFFEADFFGFAVPPEGTQTASNSNAFRLRKAYGRLGPLLAGQDKSTFSIDEGEPETIDFGGPPGVASTRQALIRYIHRFGSGLSLAFAVENPESFLVTSTNPAFPDSLTLGLSNDPIPEFAFRLRYRGNSSSASFAGLFRQIKVNDGAANAASTFGWGLTAGLGWRFNKRRTAVGGTIYGGYGIGRYTAMGFTSAVLNGTNASNQSLDAVPMVGGQVWINHSWTDTLRSNFGYGRAYAGLTTANLAPGGGKNGLGAFLQDAWRGYANVIWSPATNVDLGIEYIHSFRGEANSANGKAHRIHFGIRYRF